MNFQLKNFSLISYNLKLPNFMNMIEKYYMKKEKKIKTNKK